MDRHGHRKMKRTHTYTQRHRHTNIPKLKKVSAGENLKSHLRNVTPSFYRKGICRVEKGSDKLKIPWLVSLCLSCHLQNSDLCL